MNANFISESGNSFKMNLKGIIKINAQLLMLIFIFISKMDCT